MFPDHLDLKLLKIVRSNVDNTVKYIFLSRGQIVEFSYINKKDGKDIICAPTQTSCNLGCKFCFLSDYDLVVRNLTPEEILFPVKYIVHDLGLLVRPHHNNVLLISFMGCGEPLLNIKNVVETCNRIINEFKENYGVVRFAVASLIPKIKLMRDFTEAVKKNAIPLKFHLSLHSPDPGVRKEIMPSADQISESIEMVKLFMSSTGNSAEIHYSLIDGINDREEDVAMLTKLLMGQGIPVKFLSYNEKPSLDFECSERVDYFRETLECEGVETEFYIPPGIDIGSSCGQFLMEYYEQYNKCKS
ncbi:MAG: 23S rRNA (adenine(2503)-C(2))-methyltransferase RlmN [Patescibacteria group bacterium]|nr:MAG: 23S rRNA (adenine(2503)-C(2))-methyltransferase RlmN [Patescibacteria group bacterium]